MIKRILSILLIGSFLIASSWIIYNFIIKEESKISSSLDAVPLNTSILIRSNHLLNLREDLVNTEFWNTSKAIPYLNDLDTTLFFCENWINKNKEIQTSLTGKEVYLAVLMSGTNQHNSLLSIAINENEWDYFKTHLQNTSKTPFNARLYDDVEILESVVQNDKQLSISFHNNVCLISLNPIVIEDAIRQLNHGKSLSENLVFAKLLKTTDTNSDFNLFINFKELNPIINLYFKGTYTKTYYPFASWSEFDMNIQNNGIKGNGYVMSNDTLKNYIYSWKGQIPGRLYFQNILPSNTAFYLFHQVDNWNTFYGNRKQFLDQNGQLFQIEKNTSNFEKQYPEISIKKLSEILGGNICYFVPEVKTSGESADKGIIAFQLNDVAIAQETIINWSKLYGSDNFTENFLNYHIYENNVSFWNSYLGKPFDNCEGKFFTFMEDFVLFGDNLGNLKQVINAYTKGSTLQKSNDYQLFIDNFDTKQSFLTYYNFRFGGQLLNENIVQPFNKTHALVIDTLKNWEALAYSFQSDKELYYSSFYANYKPEAEDISIALSETKLDTTLNAIPVRVINHYSKQYEFIMQDAKNNVYLISNNGKKLWKLPLGEKIISDVYQVDRYKNNKLQYLFNTKSSIYLVDRNGEMVEDYPATIPSKASNGLALFDYDKNRNYRILLANEKNEILNYAIDGKQVKGWEKPRAKSNIRQSIEWYNLSGKDYLMAIQENGQLMVLDRKGAQRIKINEKLPASSNYYFNASNSLGTSGWYATDSIGTIYKVNLDDTKEVIPLKAFSNTHQFYLFDIDGDQYKDYIFLDEEVIYAYKLTKSKIFEYQNSEIDHLEKLYLIQSDQKNFIGFNDQSNHKTYVLDNSGNLLTDFPLEGYSPMTIKSIDKENDIRLIVGNEAGSVYFYSIK